VLPDKNAAFFSFQHPAKWGIGQGQTYLGKGKIVNYL
jgi:hypothetical protein